MNTDHSRLITEKIAGVIETVYNRLEIFRDKMLDISPKELALLVKLEPDGAMRIGEMASRLDLPLSTVSWVADRMVTGGYLERFQAPGDRRAVMIKATRKGKKTFTRYNSLFQDIASGLLEYLTEEEKSTFLDILIRIEEQMRD
jgi:DNA-binding MarR family transcriptional regulator